MEQQNFPPTSKTGANWGYRMRGFENLLRMGHCAPTVMQTILDVSSTEKEWLVRLSAGMPGGIANTGSECGGITSPLAMLGMHYGLRAVDHDLPVVFDKGHAFCQHFLTCHKTMKCREIRGKDRFPRHCIGPVLRAPEIFMDILDSDHEIVIPSGQRAAYSRLYSHLVENDFHCARAVFIHLGYSPSQEPDLFDVLSAFAGGTLFMGKTCSAFTAAVMAAGLRAGEIEDSIPRVVRLLAIMTAGGNAFDERINKFNRSMNWGYRLAKWFVREFGSTQCQAITKCDFSTQEGVSKYIECDQISVCRTIAKRVSEKIQSEVRDAVHV